MQEVKLLHNAAYKHTYVTICNELAEKGRRPEQGQNAQHGTPQDTISQDQNFDLNCHLYSLKSEAALRDRSICTFLGACLGRGDDSRLIHLADLMAPTQQLAIGKPPSVAHGNTCSQLPMLKLA